ncbi:MAG: response regulator [Deltaproteobacteria bacterium]|nr:response regulator [Deltaproteobacteria bacterium]
MSIKEAVILNCPRCGTKVRLWVPEETLSKWTAGEEIACIKCTKRFLIRVDGEGEVHVLALQKMPANVEPAAPAPAPRPAAAAAPKPAMAAPRPAAPAPPKPAAPKPVAAPAPKPAPQRPAVVTTARPVTASKTVAAPVNAKQNAVKEAEMNEAAAKEALLVAQQAALAAKQAAAAAKEALAKQTAAREAAAAAAAPKPVTPQKPKYTGPMHNILFVDNDALITARVQNTIKAENINLTIAKNFDDAIELAKRKQYDLIISDLYLQNIPGADGESLLKRIMAFSGKATPAIMTSEKQLYDDIIADRRWFDLKVKGFVEKASQTWSDDLKARIREVLGVSI